MELIEREKGVNSDNMSCDLAVIGLACRYPDAKNYEEYWNNLINGVNSIKEVPKSRWDVSKYYSKDLKEKNKVSCKWCSYIDNFEYFDNHFFNISPREALIMDPHQRQLMEVSWQCVEDSGVTLKKLQDGNTSVCIAATNQDYQRRAYDWKNGVDSYTNVGNQPSILANRISFFLGLKGENIVVDAACASGLVVINEAKKILLSGKSKYALVGGSSLILHHSRFTSYSKARMLSPDGQCKTYDQSANGFVPGEGVGVVLLQRLDEAIKENNHIYAVIKGANANHIGNHYSITAPSVSAQADVISETYEDAGINPETIGYIENHGTGTALGDPIEVEALRNAFAKYTDKKHFCKLGSVKSNIGHLEGSSGICALIKTILMLHNKKIPKTLNVNNLNPIINFEDSPFSIADELSDWKPIKEGLPLRAGVTALGFGGVCAHVLLEEYKDTIDENNENDDLSIFTLSAKCEESLKNIILKWKEFVQSNEFNKISLNDICGTTMISRSRFKYRFGFKAADKDEFKAKLNAINSDFVKVNSKDWELVLGDIDLCQYNGFKDIYKSNYIFRNQIDMFKQYLKKDVWEGLFIDNWEENKRKLYTFIVYYSFVKTLINLGVKVSTIMYEGIGFFVMLAITEVMNIKDITDYLSDCKIDNIKILRPNINYYDNVLKEVITPYKVDSSYILELFRESNVNENDLKYYINKSKVLYNNVFTFKKFLQEWNGALSKIDIDVEQLLFDAEIIKVSEEKISREQLLLLIVVISSIHKLYQKWELRLEVLDASLQFNELLDLILDNVVTKDEFIQLFNYEQCDLDKLINSINAKLHNMKKEKSYKLIKEKNNKLNEVTDYKKWLNMSEVTSITNKEYKDSLLQFGKIKESIKSENLITLDGRIENIFVDCILDLWKKGADINFEKYCAESRFNKVSLPIYEFDSKPFLLPLNDNEYDFIGKSEVDINKEISMEKCFSSTDTIIRDHVITGKHLLPGAGLITFTFDILNNYKKQKINTLRNVAILNPTIVDDKETISMEIKEGNKFGVLSGNKILCNGKYETNFDNTQSSLSLENTEVYKNININEFYKFIYKVGYEYGETFRVIEDVRKYKNKYLIKVKEKYCNNESKYSTELLDGIIQSALAVEYLEGNLELNNIIFIPYMIKRIKILNDLKGMCYVSIDKKDIAIRGRSLFANLNVYDESGKLILNIEGLQLQSCSCDFLGGTVNKNKKDLFYYKTAWVERNIEKRQDEANGKVAVVFANKDIDNKLISKFNENHKEVYYVIKGEKFEVKKNVITINSLQEKDYIDLFNLIFPNKKGSKLECNLYYLWLYENKEIINDLDNLIDMERTKIKGILYLCKSLYSKSFRNKISMQVLIDNCFVTNLSDKGLNYIYGEVYGFIKSIMNENNKINIKLIDVLSKEFSATQKVDILINESFDVGEDKIIAYRNKRRYVEAIRSVDIDKVNKGISLKDGSVYVVFGGMGGLGLSVVRKIAQTVCSNIIIFGSSNLDSNKNEKLKELNMYKSKVQYVSCDITDREKLTESFRNIKSIYKKINGVIQCAGINRDSLLMNKDWNTFEQVLQPKSRGTYLVNKLTQNEKLDFFVVFSSIVSVIGNIGQTDYAAANGFIDTFINYRSRNKFPGKSISINWTLWQGNGMGENDIAINNFSKKTGLISHESGIEAFEKILNSSCEQVIVVENDNSFETFLCKNNMIIDNSTVDKKKELNNEDKEVQLQLNNKLITMFAKLLEVDADDVDNDTDLREFGLDSVSLNEFADMINNELGTDINSTLLFEYSTIEEIADYLNEEYFSKAILKLEDKVNDLDNFIDNSITVSVVDDIEEESKDNDHKEDLEKKLITMFAKLLEVDADEVDNDTDLREFGLDSVSLNEFADMINNELGTDINSTLLFEYSTIQEIANYLNEEYKVELDIKTEEKPVYYEKVEDIAIIGISARMPQADNVQEYWDNLINQKDTITEVPKDRWDWKEYYGDPRGKENKCRCKYGGFLKDIRSFDPTFFNLSPRESELMDPQQRILLEEVWRLFEDAGYKASSLSGSNTGVFIGVGNSDYNQLMTKSNIKFDSYTSTGSYFSIVANRISYLLDLKGPSTIVDTACSSSLVAIHQAVQSIKNNECNMAIAGGVNIICSPRPYLAFSHAGMLSEDGRCKTFDKSANGYVRGEGIGVILLKSLKEAIKDGDQIYGVIKGTAVKHNGYTNSLTAPSPNAQADVIMKAFKEGNINPNTVSYIETHGTGTSLGDPIEVNGLKKAFKKMANELNVELQEGQCGLGSVKTSIGHLEFASGIAGVIKVLLSMKNKIIPGNLNFNELNPYIKLENSPFHIINSNEPWKRLKDKYGNSLPRRAGVSSFGFGGTNAHLVLEEYIPITDVNEVKEISKINKAIILISAKDKRGLKDKVSEIIDFIKGKKFSIDELKDIAYTLQVGREAMEERLALIVSSSEELEEKLKGYLQEEVSDLYIGQAKKASSIIEMFNKEDELRYAIDSWIAKGKYKQVLELWVKGLEVNWNKLYLNDLKRKKISLPTYPFAKEEFWIPYDLAENEEKKKDNGHSINVIHPLLHENISNFREQKYKSKFTIEDFFLRDHVINNKNILPGAAYLEMALMAVKKSFDIEDVKLIHLKNVAWITPLVLEKNSINVETKLEIGEDENIFFKVRNIDYAEETCNKGLVEIKNSSEFNAIDIDSLQSKCNKTILTSDQCYELFKTVGFNYGEAQQGIEKMYIGEEQVLAKIELPLAIENTRRDYILHPSLIDSAIQTTLGFMIGCDDLKCVVPFSLDELIIMNNKPHPRWVFVEKIKNIEGSTIKKFDVSICDADGAVCIEMKGLTTRQINKDVTENDVYSDEKEKTSILNTEWKEKTVEEVNKFKYSKQIVVLCDTKKINTDELYLKAQKMLYETKFINLESMEGSIDEIYKGYVTSIFEEIKNIFTSKPDGKIIMQVIFDNTETSKLYRGISGLLKTAEKENPLFVGQVIEINNEEEPEFIIDKLIENSQSPMDKKIVYKNKKRFVEYWKEITEVSELKQDLWKDSGVYLITGGAGGLGKILINEIVSKVKSPKIIICGRRNINENELRSFIDCEKSGATIEYKQVDITDKNLVEVLIEEVEKKYGGINGVIHAAGVTRDNYIYKKNKEEMLEVLDPKVTGLINLDESCKDLKLDWFMLFSSISGCIGNDGQADYAAANAFLDEYAEYRECLLSNGKRSGKTLSISWPLWNDGGMHMSKEIENRFEQSTGLIALKDDEGIDALYKAFEYEKNHVMVLHGLKEKYINLIKTDFMQEEVNDKTIEKNENYFLEEEISEKIYDEILANDLSEDQFVNLINL